MIVDNFPDRTVQIDGEEYLYFGGTSYLGLATNNEFQKILYKSLIKWGTAYGSSRNSNIKLSVYEKFENQFSNYIKAESSLAISSGMLAGKYTIDYLSKSIRSFYHFPKTHPAILSINSLPLFINGKLHPNLLNDKAEDIVISVDAILSSEVTPTSFRFLDAISNKKKITLVVDESHSLGIEGKNGEGIFDNIHHHNISRKIMVSSLAKALGLSVGVIAADKEFIEELKSEPIFVAASATNPAFLETYIQAQNLYKLQREKLQLNLDYVSSRLISATNLKYTIRYPVIYSNDDSIFSTLLKNKIVISRFKYPTYEGFLNRMVITANHTQNDLEKLIAILNDNYEK